MTYADTREGALELVRNEMDVSLGDAIVRGVEDGSLFLVPDPEVPGVWGVIDNGTRVPSGFSREYAVAVLYLAEDDFEHNVDYWEG